MRALRLPGAVLALGLLAVAPPITTLYGFSTVGSDRERVLEQTFLDVPSASGALETAKLIGASPHEPGSPGDYRLAVAMRDALASFGFAATLEPLTARVDTVAAESLTLYPSGRAAERNAASRALAAHGFFSRPRRPRTPPAVNASPVPAEGASPESIPFAVALPTPSTPGSVSIALREPPIAGDDDTANPAIGVPFLAGSADGDVTAPLVYAGYGGEADYAALSAHHIDVRGAVVVVRGSREFRGVTARRAQARGAAGVIFYDDPADNGAARGAAYPNGPYRPATSVRRGTVGEGVTIPVLPVSAATAQTLLAALHGPSAAPPWSGALPIAYPFARGPATVHLVVRLRRRDTTLWNTVGVLIGTRPDQSIVLGAHRDAWVYGVGDDGSGVTTLLETARGFGTLAHGGWRPQRSIVIAGWDGEELGAYGSIAFARRHGDDVRRSTVAYLDAEQSVTGPTFGATAVAAIANTVVDATHVVADPETPGASIYDHWALHAPTLPPLILGDAAVDHPTSLFAIGTPSANAGFGGTFGPYHSAYDTLQFATTFSDPTFALHRTAAQLFGVIALRLADAEVVPYRFGAYVGPLQSASRNLDVLARRTRVRVDTGGLNASIARLRAAAARFDAATARIATDGAGARAIEAAQVLDIALYGSNGYTSAMLPDVARAVSLGDQAAAASAMVHARAAIDHAAALLGV